MVSPPMNLANGQLAASAGTIFDPTTVVTNNNIGSQKVNLRLANTSGTNTETCTITLSVQGGTARRVTRVVLAANEVATITAIGVDAGDLLKGVATDATTVDYVVTQAGPGDMFAIEVRDSNGSLKQVNGTSITGATTITSTSASAFAAGPNGATNPGVKVDGSVSSAAGGLQIQGQADHAGVSLTAIGTNTNEPINVDPKGSSAITIGGNATGGGATGGALVRVNINPAVAVGGTAIGNANAVLEGFTLVTGADGSKAVKLPTTAASLQVKLKNSDTSNVLKVFPPVNSQINANGANAVYNVPAGAVRTFQGYNTNLWLSDLETIS